MAILELGNQQLQILALLGKLQRTIKIRILDVDNKKWSKPIVIVTSSIITLIIALVTVPVMAVLYRFLADIVYLRNF